MVASKASKTQSQKKRQNINDVQVKIFTGCMSCGADLPLGYRRIGIASVGGLFVGRCCDPEGEDREIDGNVWAEDYYKDGVP